jgi:cation:H+ antiporter
LAWALLLGGGVLLYFGAEWLVSGASRLALALSIPQLVVGLTVVAYGTSAPEVVVSVAAALNGQGPVALGNVVGSNVANLGLILGVAAALGPAKVDGAIRRRELPVLVLSAALVPVLLWDGTVSRLEGALLLVSAIAYTGWMVRSVRDARAQTAAVTDARVAAEAADAAGGPSSPPHGSKLRQGLVALVGLALLVLGGRLFVDGAAQVALTLGMSERLVGLTIVAIGTSMPELATSVIATLRGHPDIAVGNVVGSNIFNVLLCLGAAAVTGSLVDVGTPASLDVLVMLGLTALGALFLRTERLMRRWEGVTLLAGYTAFIVALVLG